MRRIGLGFAAVAAALAAAVLILPWLIPEHAVREAVRREIVALTGREPVIAGRVRLSLAPLPAVTVENITIPGLDGMPPLLQADSIEGTLRLSSLLAGRIDVSSLALETPRFALVATKDGRHSWDFKTGVLADAAAGHSEEALPVKSMRLINGTVAYSDAISGKSTVVTLRDATVNWSSLADAMSVSGVVDWRHRSTDVSISIADPSALISGGQSDLRLKMRGDMLNLNASGNLSGGGKFDGRLAAGGKSLREALRWLGLDLPEGHSLAAFNVQSPISIDANGIALSDVQLELDGNEAEGSMTVQLAEPRPKISGTLAADTLDLTPYSSEVQLATGLPRRWRSDRINLKGLVVSDLDLRISAGEMIVGKVHFGRTAAAVSTHDGLLDIALGEALTYGGTLKGRVTLKADDGGTEFAASGNFEAVELGKALGDFIGFHKLDGTGSGTFVISASGASVADLSRSMQGQATITVADGALIGIDLPDLMHKIEKRPLSARFESSYGGRTAFEKAHASFKITGGVANTRDCDLDNGNLSVQLAGNSNIASRSLDMAGIANWADGDGAEPFKLPFRVHGEWDGPLVEPDTNALLRRSGAAAPLFHDYVQPGQDASGSVAPIPAAATTP